MVDNFVEKGFNPLHFSKKRASLLFLRFPYIEDHLIEISSNGNEEQAQKASNILSFFSDPENIKSV